MSRDERCSACGRPTYVGEDFDGPCVHDSDLECAKRQRDEARREAARLRKLFDDAGQGEHNVLALVDHYQSEAMAADERARLEYDRGRRDGREDVGKYSNAIGQIESALGIVGGRPLRETVAAVTRVVHERNLFRNKLVAWKSCLHCGRTRAEGDFWEQPCGKCEATT